MGWTARLPVARAALPRGGGPGAAAEGRSAGGWPAPPRRGGRGAARAYSRPPWRRREGRAQCRERAARARAGRSAWRWPASAGWAACTRRPTCACCTTSRGSRSRRSSWPWPTRRPAAPRRPRRSSASPPPRATGGSSPRTRAWRRSASPRRTSCTARSASAWRRPASTSGSRSRSGSRTEDARAVAEAIEAAGVQGTVGFNYRNAPAVAAAREMIAGGELGTVTHARFRLFSDYAAHPEGALTWRYERERGGSGVLGDLASHGVDLARHLLGDIDVRGRRQRDLRAGAGPPGGRHGRARARGRRRARAGGERGLRRRPAALRVGRPRRPGGEPRRGRGAEQLRLRGARHARARCSGTSAG